MVNSSASFSLVGLSKSYGASTALHPTDLIIEPGEYLVLLGPSGSGKTTLLMALAGLIRPTAGEVLMGGTQITHLPPEKRGFGVVFQGYALFPHLTVMENVAFPLKVRGRPRKEIEVKAQQAIDLMRLGEFAGRLPKQLSGGQQQRVALARALVFSPALLLLDEPMSALDRQLKEELQSELKELHDKVATTFVHITHDQEEAMALADRIAVMQSGRIMQIGAPQEVYRHPVSRFVANFLGKSNFVEARALNQMDGTVTAQVDQHGVVSALAKETIRVNDQVVIAVRPENIKVERLKDDDSRKEGLYGQVKSGLFFGKYSSVEIEVPQVGLITGYIDSNQEIPLVGTKVRVSWCADYGVVVHA